MTWISPVLYLSLIKFIIWPSIVLIGGCFFKQNMRAFIDRINFAKVHGFGEIHAPSQTVKFDKQNKKIASELTESRLIDKEAQKLQSEVNEGKNNNLYKDIAIRDLIIDFERIYNFIFGSQIDLLDGLNQSPLGHHISYMNNYWHMVKNSNILAFYNWSLENYLSFLFQNGLLILDTEFYKITEKVREFLNYLTTMRYSKNKPF